MRRMRKRVMRTQTVRGTRRALRERERVRKRGRGAAGGSGDPRGGSRRR
jgi:hypothetical protein